MTADKPTEIVEGYEVPVDPMEGEWCESCQ